MTDTVTRLMEMIDEHAHNASEATRLDYETWHLKSKVKQSFADVQTSRQALHDELTRLFTPLNQCDGCMSGQVMRGALHIGDDGKPLMVCQKSKYEVENEANERNLCQLTDELAESRREVAQLQEQNTALDARLASHEAVMRMALEALKRMERYGNTFLYRRDEQNPHEQTCEAIKSLEEALGT